MNKVTELSTENWATWQAWMQAQQLLNQELDQRLQAGFDISKAEFSVLVTICKSPTAGLRVQDLATSLGWEKSRVSHLLTRMEARSLVERVEHGARGRRTGISVTPGGRELTSRAVAAHGQSVCELFFDLLSPEQLKVLSAWSHSMIEMLSSGRT